VVGFAERGVRSLVVRIPAITHFGEFLAMVITLDNPTSSLATRRILDWEPTHPGLLADFDKGRLLHHHGHAGQPIGGLGHGDLSVMVIGHRDRGLRRTRQRAPSCRRRPAGGERVRAISRDPAAACNARSSTWARQETATTKSTDHHGWKRLLAKAGVEERRLHDARHTAGTCSCFSAYRSARSCR
jgi:hypothetical protein